MHDVVTCWPSITKSLGTLDTSVLTHFCANGLTLDIVKLISLTEIPTLTALIHTNSSQRLLQPLRGNAIRDWCRAVREKDAFPKLKVLYMSSISDEGPNDHVVLDHLSSFPSLALVGIERGSLCQSIIRSETRGQWQRLSPTRGDKLSTRIRDTKTSMTEKTKSLYEYACRVSQPGIEGVRHSDEGPVSLTLSCYAPQRLNSDGPISWFLRTHNDHHSPEEPSKRTLDTHGRHDLDEQATKKRKIRPAKYDVGTLLDIFEPPLANGSAT
jgi:hypothetical protein